MSYQGTGWAWKVGKGLRDSDEGLPAGEFLTLQFIGHAVHSRSAAVECGTELIARATGKDSKTIRRHLKKFVEMGLINKEPSPKKEGRGRGFDRIKIVLDHSAATGQNDPLEEEQQPDISGAATGQNVAQQPDKTTPRSNKGGGNSGGKGGGERRKLPSVNKHRLTAEEFEIAEAILEKFNDCNNSSLGLIGRTGEATDALVRITSRVREHPEMRVEDFLRVVELNFKAPWWTDEATVGVIFGPKAWPRALVCKGVPKSNRKDRRSIDRKGGVRNGPDW